jgi:undecaprenyl-diphosphatase
MDQINNAILQGMAQWRVSWLNRAMTDITSLGSMTIATLVTVAAVILFWTMHRDRIAAATMMTSTFGGEAVVEILKRVFQEPRPTAVEHLVQFNGFSFPSGHCLVSAAAYGTLATLVTSYVRDRRARAAIRAICWTIVGLIAVSRVYLGVHYPTDVIAGVILGIVWRHLSLQMWRAPHRAGYRSWSKRTLPMP